jgi:hypothetical protein
MIPAMRGVTVRLGDTALARTLYGAEVFDSDLTHDTKAAP